MRIEFIDLKAQYRSLKNKIDGRIQNVLNHGQYILGPEVRELESRLENYTGASHCITTASGTEALLIALLALGIKQGDEVITSPFSFIAAAEMIALLGATPVFVDVEADTCNLDANNLQSAITPKTKAIIPVSLYGQTCDMEEINTIAAHHGVIVIEDAAQSFGATYHGLNSCNLSTIACTSFFPSKPLGCYGDGGALFTSDEKLATIMRQLRVHGQERRYFHSRIGVGGRMDTLQCAIVLAKLDSFDWEVERRMHIGDEYLRLLQGAEGITLPTVRPDRTSVWGQFTVQAENRQALEAQLRLAEIPLAVHYPLPLHRQPAYEGLCRQVGSMENTERLAQCVLSLPMHPFLDPETQSRIVGAVRGGLCG